MRTIKQSIITIIVCMAVVAGVSLVYSWTGPPYGGTCTTPPCPPNGNVPAPINVGSFTQYKSGALGIGGLLQTSSFQMTTGAGLGKVLTSDASGLASWTATSSLGITGGGGTSYWALSGTNIYNTNTGNVGIGTASPTTKLYVAGPSGTSGAITVDATSGTQAQLEFRIGGVQKSAVVGGSTLVGFYSFITGSAPLVADLSTGNVGIGTLSPTAKLDIENGNVLMGGSLAVKGDVNVDGHVNLGKTITLAAVDSSLTLRPVNVGASTYVPDPPDYVGSTAGTDTCNGDTNNFYWCDGITAGPACTDYGKIGSGPYYKRTVTCAVQNGNYTVKNDYNSLKFNNGFGNTELTLGQDGKLILEGQIQIKGGSPAAGKVLTSDAAGLATWQTSGLGGGGTVNYLSKFTGSGTLGNSQIFDNGTNVGIGTTTPLTKLYVSGSSGTSGAITIDTPGQSQLEFRIGGVQKSAVLGGQTLVGFYSFITGSAPLVADLSTGNVGIGTVSPSQKLDVAGNVNGTGLCIGGNCRTSWPALSCTNVTGSATCAPLGQSTASCPGGYTVTGGGYSLTVWAGGSYDAPQSSNPSGNGWQITHGGGGTGTCFVPYAVCCQTQ